MQLPEKFETIKETITDKLDSVIEWLEDKLGSRPKAVGVVAGGFIVIIVLIVLFISLIPWTAAPAPQQSQSAPVEDLGSGVTMDERSEQNAEEAAAENIPDEAKTVKELSQERIVKATFEYMVDPTHIVVTLPNKDEVTVRLVNVTPTEDCAYAEEGSNPYTLVRDNGKIWLERDTVTMEEDGTWPRYVWKTDPTKDVSLTSTGLWQAAECSPTTGNYTYTPEDGYDRNKELFEECASDGVDENEERAKKLQEEQEREWQERKEEQERKEAEAEGATADDSGSGATDTDTDSGASTSNTTETTVESTE